MLEITQLSGGYPGKTVLHSVEMSAHEGQILAIVGPNGCGKSTLLKTLCGILPAATGSATLCGEKLLSMTPKQRAQKVAYLSQSRQIPDITVERLVLYGRFPYLSYPRRYGQADVAIARAAMAQMDLLDLAQLPLAQLSGGQRQKAYIAMALAQNTPLVLLDEPTTFLDIGFQLQLMAHARALADTGKTVLMVIHDLPMALSMADRVAVMADGRILASDTPEAIFDSGILDQVFGIRIHRVQTPDGCSFVCRGK